MPSITDLTHRFERRPLPKPNATYLWRFAANGVRAGRALVTPPAFGDTRAIARELTAQDIASDPATRSCPTPGVLRSPRHLPRSASRGCPTGSRPGFSAWR